MGLVSGARAAVVQRATEFGHDDLADDTKLVLSELVTNAMLHGGGCTGVEILPIGDGLRIEVRDGSRRPPLLGRPSEETLTGRGLRLVSCLAERWGATVEDDGKVVWAEITGRTNPGPVDVTEDELLAMWDDERDLAVIREPRFHVALGEVPTDLLLAAKSHVENVVRELTLASAGARAGLTTEIPPHLASLVSAVVDRFAEARLAIKRQALDAARQGQAVTRLVLDLPASAAEAAEDYVQALDEVDAYCRARRLLTLETPPQHHLFRHWYIGELVTQLRAAAAGKPAPVAQSFTRRLLAEVDRVASAHRTSERVARLYTVAAALATAATPEAVAEAVLNEGVAALGAAGGGLLLTTDADQLSLPGAVGYDETVLAGLRTESRDAELPAAAALRSGEPVWLESRAERDERFPRLAGLEATTVALCAVPLELQGRRLGALRFSFDQARLFDDDERRFVLTLAAQTAQALDRAQLQRDRIDVSRRLQRSLLPPNVPEIPGLDIAAVYHPFGDGVEVGGDFYDIWPVRPGQWAVSIGDAAGTGPEAAGLTALVRHTLRALAMGQQDPPAVMAALNTALREALSDPVGERFCTAIFGLITVGDGIELWAAGGGHPPLVVQRADGRTEALRVGGSLLGLFADAEIESIRVRLQPGDTLVLLTDGVLEAKRDGHQFDISGVERVLAAETGNAAAVAVAIESAVLRHTGRSLTDDVAILVLRVPRDT
jgi:serine phosphatase RsbU (regulator of sigma subunit)